MSRVDRQTAEKLASLAGWNIAKYFACSYEGDSDPIRHGGVFYDPRDWAEYGYASCVEFWADPDSREDTLVVSSGTIHRPGIQEVKAALQHYGLDWTDDVHQQIEACRAYNGIEPDDCVSPRRYKLDHWHEWRIWRSVSELLAQLGE